MNRQRTPGVDGVVSFLLQYPDGKAIAARSEVAAAVQQLPRGFERQKLEEFLGYWLSEDPATLRQRYVDTFDLGRCSLHLSHFLYGDTRQRGAFLLRLKRLYAAAGLVVDGRELPDYLPLVLEFAARSEPGRGELVLAELRVPLEMLHRALAEIGSPYSALIDAIRHRLPGLSLRQASDLQRHAAESQPIELVGLEPFAPPEVMPMGSRP